jgi:hypothetical protein
MFFMLKTARHRFEDSRMPPRHHLRQQDATTYDIYVYVQYIHILVHDIQTLDIQEFIKEAESVRNRVK